jgi:hypothetical protein
MAVVAGWRSDVPPFEQRATVDAALELGELVCWQRRAV